MKSDRRNANNFNYLWLLSFWDFTLSQDSTGHREFINGFNFEKKKRKDAKEKEKWFIRKVRTYIVIKCADKK